MVIEYSNIFTLVNNILKHENNTQKWKDQNCELVFLKIVKIHKKKKENGMKNKTKSIKRR